MHGDDEANNQLLLKELEEVAEPRTARYECAVALCAPGREDVVGEGACEGEILRQYQGEGGFGYDPLFLSHDLGVTLSLIHIYPGFAPEGFFTYLRRV